MEKAVGAAFSDSSVPCLVRIPIIRTRVVIVVRIIRPVITSLNVDGVGITALKLRSRSTDRADRLRQTFHLHLGDCGYRDRLSEVKGQQALRRNIDLSAARCGRGANAESCADSSTDRGAGTAASSGANDAAYAGTDSGSVNRFGGFVTAVVGPDIGGEGIDVTAESDGGEL